MTLGNIERRYGGLTMPESQGWCHFPLKIILGGLVEASQADKWEKDALGEGASYGS